MARLSRDFHEFGIFYLLQDEVTLIIFLFKLNLKLEKFHLSLSSSFSLILLALPSPSFTWIRPCTFIHRANYGNHFNSKKKSWQGTAWIMKRKFPLLSFCFSVPGKSSKFSLKREEKTNNINRKVAPLPRKVKFSSSL